MLYLHKLFNFDNIKEIELNFSNGYPCDLRVNYNPYEIILNIAATVYPVTEELQKRAYDKQDSCYSKTAHWLKKYGNNSHLLNFIGTAIFGTIHIVITNRYSDAIVFGLSEKNLPWVKFAQGVDRVWVAKFSLLKELI